MAHSLTPDGTRFTLNGDVIDSVSIQIKRGRYRYVSTATDKLLASGMSPETFARRYWFATQWREPEKPSESRLGPDPYPGTSPA